MSLQIVLKNNTDAPLFAHITGTSSSGLFFLKSDGTTAYTPPNPTSAQTPLGQDCTISVGNPGASKTVTVPHISGARVWFSKDSALQFFLNPGPAVVEPSATNVSDANYEREWGFAELTFNSNEVYANISFVDFVSLPISIQLQNQSGKVTTVQGLPSGGLDTICDQLAAQAKKDGKGWDKLVIKNKSGQNLRALSPNSGGVLVPGLFDKYYSSYVDSCWSKHTSSDLTINTQFGTWGDVKGRVDSSGKLNFPGVASFAKPSAADIFSCSTGPFAGGAGVSAEQLNIGARLAAALNRSTLDKNATQPEGEKVSTYYQEDVTNHYSRICHAVSLGGRGYAFPYDDVGSSTGEDQSGFLNDPKPKVLTVSVGKPL